MTAEEMVDGLGIIARSGARMFLDHVSQTGDASVSADIIGQFGVGFYSVFMVADRIEVASRSYSPDAEAVSWSSTGDASGRLSWPPTLSWTNSVPGFSSTTLCM